MKERALRVLKQKPVVYLATQTNPSSLESKLKGEVLVESRARIECGD